ncbi:domain found in IF2B/IF5-domain-containing protein [Zychaea mexicana]|uniref:domain found in IF2B/IF5-domain-containing protein n=1 Tax=Zychaea mexicana TaxID=64656 RepID=UPI0022FDF5AE|nr:domain found in IF2B/IF5-domain-containing protein [Zychaea mexicana]KAI9488363.1 domain found in IF2B/IF5-domain-containing protein [Zychaea mexicana]
MSDDKENKPVVDQVEEEEPDFSKLKKKKKSKKKVDFDDTALADEPKESAEVQDAHNADDADPDAMFAELKKKKKKKSKPVEDAGEGDSTPAEGNDEDMDFGAMKKKKKKKKNMAEFEAELAEQEGESGEQEGDKPTKKDNSDETWLKSDRDYTYDELLGRIFKILRQNNPELAGEKKRYTIVPPSIHREGNKKTIFANVADICKRLHRQPEHVIQFLFAELGTNGSVDGAQRLVIKGRWQQKQIENVLRRYIVEYVTCKTCKSPDTILSKDNRLYFVQCESCGSTRSVSAIKTGFKAQTKEDRRALRA